MMHGTTNINFNSGLLISRTFITHARSPCTLLCLYLAPCTQKMCWRAHSLADIVTPFFLNILQFSSELSNKWDTGLPFLRPFMNLCTGQQHKASFISMFLFLSFLPLFTVIASWIVLIIRTSPVLQRLHHYITIPPERWLLFFQAIAFPERSRGMPLLALKVP